MEQDALHATQYARNARFTNLNVPLVGQDLTYLVAGVVQTVPLDSILLMEVAFHVILLA